MLNRVTRLSHPNGFIFSTPLLIPSYSSRGFLDNPDFEGGVGDLYRCTSNFLNEGCLVSGYDLNYDSSLSAVLNEDRPPLIVVDSGGYEKAGYKSETWSPQLYSQSIEKLPEEMTTALVSYDEPCEEVLIEIQIERAKNFFDNHKNCLKVLLLKAEARGTSLNLSSLNGSLNALKEFDVIGVTEKEIGNSIADRINATLSLRMMLDAADVKAPIHIFGCLNPFHIGLYFLAGAEIFDGLNWSRSFFENDTALHWSEYTNTKSLFKEMDFNVRLSSMLENLSSLDLLTERLKSFNTTGEAHFLPRGQICIDSFLSCKR